MQDERGSRFNRLALARGTLAPFVIRKLDALGYPPRIIKDDAPGNDARSRRQGDYSVRTSILPVTVALMRAARRSRRSATTSFTLPVNRPISVTPVRM